MKSKRLYFGLSLFFVLLLSLSPFVVAGPKAKHVISKGDNLWSICERYYNDPWIWPELWEMNIFITNPHWIRPGEIITLYDYETLKAKAQKRMPATNQSMPATKEQPKPSGETLGIDVSSITNINALGFLQQEKEEPWGTIFDLETEKILVSKNDIVYVRMYKEGVKPGDTFTIYNTSNPINHPITGEHSGYIHSFKGIVEIEKADQGYHIARITESFRTIRKGDLLIPYEPVSTCILPIPCQGTVYAHVVAGKDDLTVHGQGSVVYIDAGRTGGLMTGNLFEAIQERESIADPQKKEKVALPPVVLGRILILQTKEDTAIGIVFWASKDFGNAAKIRSCSWEKQPIQLAILPTCPIQ
ncbi:MAG TPA: LysM peptidoglycan-binding domain-containing protein [Desulfatiglandales bacterium]|nr:LysM peptidoglycan-binding domain-containing protein [Desulfatiglandales bacterium]